MIELIEYACIFAVSFLMTIFGEFYHAQVLRISFNGKGKKVYL